MVSKEKRMSNSWLLSALVALGAIFILSACDGDGPGAEGAECTSFFDCNSGLLCYSGLCKNAVNPALTCQVDIDQDTDNDGVVDLRGCNPVDTSPDDLRVVCVAQRCRIIADDPPVLVPDSGLSDTGTISVPDSSVDSGVDSGVMDLDAAFVAPATACSFPPSDMVPSNNEDTSAPSFFGLPTFTVNGMPGSAAVSSGDTFSFVLKVRESCGLAWAKVVLQAGAAAGTTNPAEQIVLEGAGFIGLENGSGSSMDESLVTVSGAVSPCLQNTGQYAMTELHLRDYAGNRSVYTLSSATGTYNLSQNGGASSNSGVPQVKLSVAGTGTTESFPAPLGSVSVSSSASGVDVVVAISNQDDNCYLNRAIVTLTSSAGQVLTGEANAAASTPPANGELTASVAIPACAQKGAWTVSSVQLVDSAGRNTVYSTSAGANYQRSDGNATVINPASVTLTGGTDEASPDLLDVQLQVSGESSGTKLEVNVAATDDACLVESNSVSFTHSTGASFSADLSVNGDSVGSACLAIPLCAPRGDYTLSSLSVADEGGASTLVSESSGTYTLSKTDSSTTGWVPPSVITFAPQ